jgi:hypothetical protein
VQIEIIAANEITQAEQLLEVVKQKGLVSQQQGVLLESVEASAVLGCDPGL